MIDQRRQRPRVDIQFGLGVGDLRPVVERSIRLLSAEAASNTTVGAVDSVRLRILHSAAFIVFLLDDLFCDPESDHKADD
ncbi:MAG: hypothetical protein DWQ34_18330 [Planctomycetota bacterium]|nr:MAG: hypothetical protein DWQ34_18330 [Planctomycetota bacterium]REJ95976.1 MAG: hypothetical protein DWQ29_01350 [Planctomycetota bacterium]REK21531.1 MAG: hypothetical protein DWQ41_20890 [Planctomycetota bacterium]REK39914.1 MAG: hypothetical protein DWQ45_01205 [Planctomycetota bacterium]